jgi:serine O-acetyltransferase
MEHDMSIAPERPNAEPLSLLELVREDLHRHNGRLWAPGFQALAVQRFGAWARTRPGLGGKIARRAHKALFVFVRNVYGIELHAETRIGRRLLIGHQHGIVIHPRSTIGDDCVLRHNVTLGAGARYWTDEAPHLDDRVRVGPGVVVIGEVHIGHDVQIGPNALVTTDVPPGAMVFQKPSRIVQLGRNADASVVDDASV